MDQLAIKLSNVDEPEKWKTHVFGLSKHEVAAAYKMAIPLWVKRMLHSGQLLVHPDVAKTIEAQGWELNDLHARMTWASILATDTSPQRRERRLLIKEKIIKKHGRAWWEDVYKRVKPAYAAREEIKKILNVPPASRTFKTSTILGRQIANDEKLSALRMIPKF